MLGGFDSSENVLDLPVFEATDIIELWGMLVRDKGGGASGNIPRIFLITHLVANSTREGAGILNFVEEKLREAEVKVFETQFSSTVNKRYVNNEAR